MVGDTGIEPVTPSMSTKCSTAELITHRAVRGSPRSRKSLLYKRDVWGVQVFWRTEFSVYTLSMIKDAYIERLPKAVTTSVVFASPHSGRHYSDAFRSASVLDERTLRSSEDAYIDELIDAAPDLGAQSLLAVYPRAFVDLNRAATELDPAVLSGMRRATVVNPRIASGLGVIPRVVANGRAIYRGKIALTDGYARLDRIWHPYHARLEAILAATQDQFGHAILLDCHSMPHEAIETHRPASGPRPDIVLGDRFGAAADGAIVEAVEAAFRAAGLVVARNAPFAGAYIAQRYGKPGRGRHVIQIEIDRSLYLDEENVARGPNFASFRRVMAGVMTEVAEIGRPLASLAAE